MMVKLLDKTCVCVWARRSVTNLSILIGICALAGNGRAQEVQSWPLPLLRAPDRSVPVPSVGQVPATNGSTTTLPVTAALAVGDLGLYDVQIASVFAGSAAYYPADSIAAQTRERAAAWLTRIQSAYRSGSDETPLLELLDVVAVTLRAEQDTLAQQLIERHVAALPSGRKSLPLKSLMLSAAVALLADPSQDSARL